MERFRRKLTIGAAVVAAAAFAGGAYAVANSSSTSPRQAFLNDVAKRLKVSPSQLKGALQGAFFDQLQAAVAAGRLTQAQANRIEQHIKQMDSSPLGGGLLRPRAFGPAGPGGPVPAPPPLGGPDPRLMFGFGREQAAAAGYLGLTQTQLRNRVLAGKSLAQIAKAQHKSAAGLEQVLVSTARARLDKAVAAGRITSAQEQALLKLLSSRIDAVVNGNLRMRFYRHLGAGPRFLAPGGKAGPGGTVAPGGTAAPGPGTPPPPML